MSKYIAQHRRGTTNEWATVGKDIIPLKGEIVIELDDTTDQPKHKLKIGDGEHKYSELAYLMAGDEIITQVLTQVKPRVVTVILGDNWVETAEGRYGQEIILSDITQYSRLDLQPDVDMLAEFKQLGLVFVTENNNGKITVYSVGNQPSQSYTMQATVVETECDGQDTPVIGIPVGAPVPQSNWTQTDETKADYIKNKPVLGLLSTKDTVERTDLSDDVQSVLNYGWELLVDDTITEDEVTAATDSGDPIKASSYLVQDSKEYDAVSVLMYVPAMAEVGNIELTINDKGIGKVVGALPTSNNMILRIEAEKTYAWKSDFFFTPTSISHDADSLLAYNTPYSTETKTIASCYRNFVTANVVSSISIISNKALPAGTVVKMMARRVK